ncbi:hypothetical protein [Rhizobium leguminosarum]|uniref:hypothetical protein n=1 Tax=Rhizobium leguminosarum TaxID=384 RepID=UPI001AE85681|nr:hypothetical protein [Rhizobium leguminosarum]MBP2443233.1 hypothetical protein [Rhizobium leguminosarum]MBP2443247.1 hypothetical protein [Rhizobium leguminosarum]MBP2444183.1 hypothetical protein [Rhizobium leguminosarum]MBP2444218.1 hypothetical protein [Rhizobium leguminosarum]MBP2444824.1 hypothetical protein [Rhizobium leguminosarum]
MIDDPEKTDHLVRELEASLPLETRLSQTLKITLTKQSPDLEIPDGCNVTSLFYMGEEGGIVCALDIGGPETKTPCIVSITHLIFNKRMPPFRQIDAYQRHRIKKLKQQNGRNY